MVILSPVIEACSPTMKREYPIMKSSIHHVAIPVLLTLTFITTSAWAQTPAASNPSEPPAAMAPATAAPAAKSHAKRHAKEHANFVEKRITELHTELAITSQQAPQWDAFAQVMRENAQKADQGFEDRAKKLPTMNANEAMKSYAELAQMHADNVQKLTTAFSALYATFSDTQKKTADVLFRNEHMKKHMTRHKHVAPSSPTTPAPESK
jgi:hypothetical protein